MTTPGESDEIGVQRARPVAEASSATAYIQHQPEQAKKMLRTPHSYVDEPYLISSSSRIQKPASQRIKPPLESRKELLEKIVLLDGQSEDLKAKLDDIQMKLKGEISRTAELAQQLEDRRRENGDLQRAYTRLQEESQQDRTQLKQFELKNKHLEMKVKKAENDLRKAQKSHAEKLNEDAFRLERCVSELSVSTAALKEERKFSTEMKQKLEGYATVQQAIKLYEEDQEKWTSERKALMEDLAAKEQTIQQLKNYHKARIQELEKSAEEQLQDFHRSRSEWEETVQTGRDALQRVRAELDSRTVELNDMKESLFAERKLAALKAQALKDATQKLADRRYDLNLELLHVNIERLVQQLRSVRSAFVAHEIKEEKVLETCDYLGWQLVSISDTIKEGIKDVTEPKPPVPTTTNSASALEPPPPSTPNRATQGADVWTRPQSPLFSPMSETLSPSPASPTAAGHSSRDTPYASSSQRSKPEKSLRGSTLTKAPSAAKKKLHRVPIDSESDEPLPERRKVIRSYTDSDDELLPGVHKSASKKLWGNPNKTSDPVSDVSSYYEGKSQQRPVAKKRSNHDLSESDFDDKLLLDVHKSPSKSRGNPKLKKASQRGLGSISDDNEPQQGWTGLSQAVSSALRTNAITDSTKSEANGAAAAGSNKARGPAKRLRT